MDVAAQPGQGISRDIGRGEAVEHELTAFIEKRHEQRVKSEGEPGRLAVVVSVPGARLPGACGRRAAALETDTATEPKEDAA